MQNSEIDAAGDWYARRELNPQPSAPEADFTARTEPLAPADVVLAATCDKTDRTEPHRTAAETLAGVQLVVQLAYE